MIYIPVILVIPVIPVSDIYTSDTSDTSDIMYSVTYMIVLVSDSVLLTSIHVVIPVIP